MEYSALHNLKTDDYEYPGEKNAFALLKKIPFLNQAMEIYLKLIIETYCLPEVQGDFYRVTEETCPEIYRLYKIALSRLDIATEYPLYAKSQFDYNAYATGGSPYIVVHSSVLQNFAPDELLFILGHELGHIKSGHTIYSNMAENIRKLIAKIPVVGQEAALGLLFALYDWYRMHELTADRAGAIAAGGTDAGIRGMSRLMGADNRFPLVHLTTADILKQNDSFEEANEDLITKLICFSRIVGSTHPWAVTRIKALHDWSDSGEFDLLIREHIS